MNNVGLPDALSQFYAYPPAPGHFSPPVASSSKFHQLLEEIGALHDRKQQDYGSDEDPFANVRSCSEFGVAPWVGALVRLNDKIKRLQKFAKRGMLVNESAEDSMYDIAVYALIALILYREEAECRQSQ